ncbi:MAG: cvrA [Frankiales bacterium]|nr:cvrA [Frankiales bacterium]
MQDSVTFGVLVLAASVAALLAVQSHRLSARVRIPTPAFFLVAAALAVELVPSLQEPGHRTVERVVTLALLVILFDGGLHIGAARARAAAPAILSLGVLGTFATVAGAAVLVHLVLGVSWYAAVLVATAIAPTDPAVVFSVLGQREIDGRSGTVLEGESGANDPVGIALMAALLGAGSLSGEALTEVVATFALQMVIGTAVGLIGGRALLWLMRRSPLPAEGLYPVRTLVAAGALFGLATVAHGSGFLAVFLAGIVLGDERAPYKREIERFHSALASLGEVVAFAFLGLTVHLDVLGRYDVWVPGLAIGVLLALVVRPLLGLPLLLPAGLSRGERAFVLFAGLKGAVPLLLGSLLVFRPDGERLYGVVVVVVVVSVVLQGALVPSVAKALGVRMQTVELEPFSLGVRLRDEPRGAYRVTVAPGSVAHGCRIEDIPGLAEGTWVSLLLRDRILVPVRGDTVMQPWDEVLLIVDDEQDPDPLIALFSEASGIT